MASSLDSNRLLIDKIDQQLMALLAERSLCVQKIASIKSEQKLAIYDPQREKQIIKKIKQYNPSVYHELDVINIFQAILRAGLHLQLVARSE